MKLTSKLIILFILFNCATAVAQEYRYEIGGMAGMSTYMGDANQTSLMQEWNPSGGIVFRDNLNFRWALKGGLSYGKITGDTQNNDNVFPLHAQTAFNRTMFALDVQAEFNFLPYSDKYAFMNTSKITPYLLIGAGFAVATGNDRTFFGMNIPIGIGMKYKMRNKINIGVEYAVHKFFTDDFDAPDKNGFTLDNPYRLNNSVLKNNDWYNTLFFSITFEFGIRDGRCATF